MMHYHPLARVLESLVVFLVLFFDSGPAATEIKTSLIIEPGARKPPLGDVAPNTMEGFNEVRVESCGLGVRRSRGCPLMARRRRLHGRRRLARWASPV